LTVTLCRPKNRQTAQRCATSKKNYCVAGDGFCPFWPRSRRHARELARERKAEPGARAARRERIGLGEILEQVRLLLGGEPDAGVGN
jgi:hypothetical protein